MTSLSTRSYANQTSTSTTKPEWQKWRNPNHYSSELPVFKKGVERWVNDFSFRDSFAQDPIAALKYRELDLNPHDLTIMVDAEMAKQYSASSDNVPKLVRQYRDFISSKKRHCIEIRDSYPLHPKWSAWRRRMIGSTLWRENPIKHRKLVHAPFTIELTKGCTVGCWFCGVDAEKYQGHVEINGKTELIWRRLLESFRSICGTESAQHGFCYWATDPLDHPDYEWFTEEFHSILGYWPQTTTAQGMKQAARMRRLFETIKTKNAFVQRFSMTRSTEFNAIHDYFSPQELFLCELIPQYDDRLSKKATAGRVRDLVIKRKQQNKPIPFHHNLEDTGSIACVSGFLGNLVQQSLKLITPCSASDRWPLGYRILDERHFDNPDDIEPLILDMLETSLNDRLLPSDTLEPYPGIDFSASESDKLCISRHGVTLTLSGIANAKHFAELLSDDPMTLNDLCVARSKTGVDPLQTCLTLTRLFNQGIFNEQAIDDARAINRSFHKSL